MIECPQIGGTLKSCPSDGAGSPLKWMDKGSVGTDKYVSSDDDGFHQDREHT